MKSIPEDSGESTPRIVTPEQVKALAEAARERTFGCSGRYLQEAILHGYLLALEEVMRG